jgi:hypothetical protein
VAFAYYGMNQSIFATTAGIATVVSKSPRNALSLVIGKSLQGVRL